MYESNFLIERVLICKVHFRADYIRRKKTESSILKAAVDKILKLRKENRQNSIR